MIASPVLQCCRGFGLRCACGVSGCVGGRVALVEVWLYSVAGGVVVTWLVAELCSFG